MSWVNVRKITRTSDVQAVAVTSDNDLVARVLARQDRSAFGELVKRHQAQVRNFLQKLTGETSTSDDLAQDTFVHAWERLAGYQARGTFIGWLLKIAYTRFLQLRRRTNRYDEILDAAAHESIGETHRDAETTDLDRFMALLTINERAVMTLCYAVGMSHREASEILGIPVGTVKTMIMRSKERIRDHFSIGCDQEDCRE